MQMTKIALVEFDSNDEAKLLELLEAPLEAACTASAVKYNDELYVYRTYTGNLDIPANTIKFVKISSILDLDK